MHTQITADCSVHLQRKLCFVNLPSFAPMLFANSSMLDSILIAVTYLAISLQVVIPLGSVSWPNKRHEKVTGASKGDGLPSSQRSIGAANGGQTVV